MLKNFLTSLTEGKYGKTVKTFPPARLSANDKSSLSFMVNEQQGRYQLILVLQEDEGHEIEREYCDVDISCLDEIEYLIGEVKKFVKETSHGQAGSGY